MLHRHFRESSDTMIERPLCPKCQIRMMLLGVDVRNAHWITRPWQRTR
jgi:hypothetical protein